METKKKTDVKQKERYKKWCAHNRDKIKKYQKEWYIRNKAKIKEYRERNKEKRKEYQREYYKRNREKLRKYNKEFCKKRYKRNKEKWMKIIEEKFGGIQCKNCGYNKCFAALDFHHKDPSSKDVNIGNLINFCPTIERIEKLNDVELLCANCHRELHAEERRIYG